MKLKKTKSIRKKALRRRIGQIKEHTVEMRKEIKNRKIQEIAQGIRSKIMQIIEASFQTQNNTGTKRKRGCDRKHRRNKKRV